MTAAVSAGKRRFVKIAVAADGMDICMPCGICRQVISEFAEEMVFLCANQAGEFREFGMEDILPNRFGFERHDTDGKK